ncbi:MAG: GNAT family N-acetyltransferase [Rubrobacteraceae bacterium]|nr:GNAT family N-acetyltransferase [Rubrobacteraceae bacterium]
MHIALAGPADMDYLVAEDRHLPRGVLEQKVERREILLLWHEDRRAGALRYGYFWDEIPFMNLLWVNEGLRGTGLGTGLISFWEEQMRESGYEMVMTSSLSNERAQHLYRRLGYNDCGSLLMPEEPLEILFCKRLT